MRGKLAAVLMMFLSGCCGKEGKIVERDGCTYYYNGCGMRTGADCVNKKAALIESEENEQK